MKFRGILVSPFFFILSPFLGQSQVNADDLVLGSIFANNMVLQRDAPITVWGWGEKGQNVTVAMRDHSATTVIADDGSWRIIMPPVGLGDPFRINVASNGDSIWLNNVVAGEVWICSGQSNMEWTVGDSADAKTEIASGDYPMIRHVKIHNLTRLVPQKRVSSSGWQVCNPRTVKHFSAVGYYFAKRLHKDLRVPIGLVNATWGGTVIEAWIEGKMLRQHKDFVEVVKRIEVEAADVKRAATFAKAAADWKQQLPAALNRPPEDFHHTNFDDSNWKTIPVPAYWEGKGYRFVDGVAWYRRRVELPANWIGKPLMLSLGTIDDNDVTYVNGRRVGGTDGWNIARRYQIDPAVNDSTTVSIAVRVVDFGSGGGMVGSPEDYALSVNDASNDKVRPIPLAGQWKMRLEPATERMGPAPNPNRVGHNTPTGLFNAMINPLIPFKIKGVIWYQGEANTSHGRQYRTLFPMLIDNWRNKWQDEFSFYWVQLANFRRPAMRPYNSKWAELREAQSKTLALPKTGQAVTIDIGDAHSIHPKNKQDVGTRLALHALAKDYGHEVKFSGPVFQKMAIQGDQARLSFQFSAGLKSSDGNPLARFEIAAADKRFYWAEAKILGNEIIISSTEVKAPMAVRYAWADNPDGCNLTNETGLPASPFRSDDW